MLDSAPPCGTDRKGAAAKATESRPRVLGIRLYMEGRRRHRLPMRVIRTAVNL